MRRVRGGKRLRDVGGQLGGRLRRNRDEPLAQRRVALCHRHVLRFEPVRHRGEIGPCCEQAREQALLLVLVVMDGRRIEVPHDRGGRAHGLRIGAVLREMGPQARERGELLLDPAVACAQHAQRVVEAGGGCGVEKVGHGAAMSGLPTS